MKRFAAVVIALAVVGIARAEEKANPTGTWKWTTEFGGKKRETTLKLKLEGDKLTGSMPGRQNTETKIENGTFKNGEVSFTVTREFQGNKVTSKYTAKITGDTMKGTIETERDGKTQKRDFEAKRATD